MIDLEALALARARALNQSESDWENIFNGELFGSLLTTLTDGEIEDLFACANSGASLKAMCESFLQARQNGVDSPFQVWKDLFSKLNVGPLEAAELWQKAWVRYGQFDACLNAIMAGRSAG